MTKRSSATRSWRDEAGGALAEFAIALPLFLVLVMGVIDFSLYTWYWSSTVKATQIGAREAVVRTPLVSGLVPVWDDYRQSDIGRSCSSALGVSTGLCPVIREASCEGSACLAGFDEILREMRRAQPRLQAEHVRFHYAPTGLGYVGWPGALPVVVTVSVRCFTFKLFFLDAWFNWGISSPGCSSKGALIQASSSLISESLQTR